MRTSRTLVFHGPNVWSRNRVLEVWLEGAAIPAGPWQRAIIQIHDWVAGYEINLYEEPANPADMLCRLTLVIQQLADAGAVTGWVDPRSSAAHARFAVEFNEESVARRSL